MRRLQILGAGLILVVVTALSANLWAQDAESLPTQASSEPPLEGEASPLWVAMTRSPDSLLADELWTFFDPAADLSGEEPPPLVAHLCGEEARSHGRSLIGRFAATNRLEEPDHCYELTCSFHLHHSCYREFYAERDASGTLHLTTVEVKCEREADLLDDAEIETWTRSRREFRDRMNNESCR